MEIALIELTAILGILLGFGYLRAFFKHLPESIHILYIIISGTLLYCNGGVLVTYSRVARTQIDALFFLRGVSDSNVLNGLLYVFAFVAVAQFAVMHLPFLRISSQRIVAPVSRIAQNSRAFLLCGLTVCAIGIVLVALNRMGYHNDIVTDKRVTANESHNDIFRELLIPFIFMLVTVCGYRIGINSRRLTTLPFLMLTFALLLVQGRRMLIIGLFLFVVGYYLNFDVRPKARWVLVGSVGLLLPIGFVIFMAIRTASYSHPKNQQELLIKAYDVLSTMGSGQRRDLLTATQESVDTRGFGPVLYLAELTGADRSNLGAGGDLFTNALTMATPAIVLPTKMTEIVQSEDIAYKKLKLNFLTDESNTLLSETYTDFREAGLIFSVFLLTVWISIAHFCIRTSKLDVFKLAILALTVTSALAIESTMTSLFVAIRDTLLLFIVDAILVWFVPTRSAKYRAASGRNALPRGDATASTIV